MIDGGYLPGRCVYCETTETKDGGWELVGSKTSFAEKNKVSGAFCSDCKPMLKTSKGLEKIKILINLRDHLCLK